MGLAVPVEAALWVAVGEGDTVCDRDGVSVAVIDTDTVTLGDPLLDTVLDCEADTDGA